MARLITLVMALLLGATSSVVADDWIALKLRGTVLELVDGAWHPLERGDAIPETHVIRTLSNSRVLLQRGTETVELGPETQVQIFMRGSDRFTTVSQYFGEVTVEADVEKVKHFAVQTPYLAAVVKGTIFTVRSDGNGASVEVQRGAVGVTSKADRSSVTVRAGQEASTSRGGQLEVSGDGDLPVVVDARGKPVGDKKAKSNNGNGASTSSKSSNDNSGNGKSDKGESDNKGRGNSGKGNSGDDDEEDD